LTDESGEVHSSTTEEKDRFGISVACGSYAPGSVWASFSEHLADPLARIRAGAVYLVGGGPQIYGALTTDNLGKSVADAGDVDGDGIGDLLMMSPGMVKRFYLVLGRSNWPAPFDLLSETTDVVELVASTDNSAMGDFGANVSGVGDVNGDGYGDFCVGYENSSAVGMFSGACYLVFGSPSLPNTIDLSTLNGTNGVRIFGVSGESLGSSVGHVGDVNADGYDDLLLGAFGGDGAIYVVFGRASWPAELDLSVLTGLDVTRFAGIQTDSALGSAASVKPGDFNDDGINDLSFGAFSANPGARSFAGQAYVVFGHSGDWLETMDLTLLDGTNGMQFDGLMAGDNLGRAVTFAGDVNGDGIDDIALGAQWWNDDDTRPGRFYVVYGKSSWTAGVFDLSSLDGSNGFLVTAAQLGGKVGRSLDVCDVNGDGYSDIVTADYRFNEDAGRGYIVYGFAQGPQE
jgi:hypothetical protein